MHKIACFRFCWTFKMVRFDFKSIWPILQNAKYVNDQIILSLGAHTVAHAVYQMNWLKSISTNLSGFSLSLFLSRFVIHSSIRSKFNHSNLCLVRNYTERLSSADDEKCSSLFWFTSTWWVNHMECALFGFVFW